MFEQIKAVVSQIKKEKPLVLNITNDVTMDLIANGLLAMGASPVMSSSEQEMEDLLNLAQVLVVNLGTLNPTFIELCETACAIANRLSKPIILDPVGAGATRYRTQSCVDLLEKYAISIVRGNASEIMALSGASTSTKGVDSTVGSESAVESAQQLSERYRLVVTVSGETDWVIQKQQIGRLNRGSYLMTYVTGAGCLLSSVVGAFHAVEKDPFQAAQLASVFYGVCGEMAAEKASSPGSFRVAFLDALYGMPEKQNYETTPQCIDHCRV